MTATTVLWARDIMPLRHINDNATRRTEGPQQVNPGRGRIARRLTRLMLAMVALNVLWRSVRYGLNFPIWGDEAMLAVNFLRHGFLQLMGPLDHNQVAPLGFLWVERAVRVGLGHAPAALRLVPFLAGTAAMFVFWRLADRIVDRRQALLAVALFAASYYPLRHSVEIKPYATDLLIALCLLWLGAGLWRYGGAPWRWGAFTVAGGLAVWCSYPSVFIACGVLLALAACGVVRHRATWSFWAIAASVLGASCLLMLFTIARTQAAQMSYADMAMWKNAFPPLDRPWRFALWLIEIHSGRMMSYPEGGKNFGSVGTFLLFLAGCITMYRQGRDGRTLLALLLAPFVLTMAAAVFKKYPYGGSTRTSLYLAPAICLLAAVGLLAILKRILRPRCVRSAITIVVAICAVLILLSIVHDVLKPYKTLGDEGVRRAVEKLVELSGPHDVWLVANSAMAESDKMGYVPGGGLTIVNFDFLLRTKAPVPVLRGPPPPSVELPAGTLWVLLHDIRKYPLPEQVLGQYVEHFGARAGPARVHRFVIDEVEVLEAHGFGGSDQSIPPAAAP